MGISRVFFPSQPRLHDDTGAYSVHTIDYVSHYLSHYVFWICVESGLQENGNTLLLFCLEWLCTMPFGQVPPQGTYFGVIFVAFWTSKFFTVMHYSRVVFEAARVTGFEITTVFLASPPDSFMFSFLWVSSALFELNICPQMSHLCFNLRCMFSMWPLK